jgi:hypothetical protein
MSAAPPDFWWLVFAVFIGVGAYRCAEVLTRGLLEWTSRTLDAWLWHRHEQRLRRLR